ncbi:MAG TPA: hypothetical protein VGF48_15325 [Thermoanaerobaculia bacterium]|jgi:hypothetical protein
MPGDTKEPQSYGSGSDWVTGKTGEQVNDQKSAPPAEHSEFYDERRESEESAPDQGGKVSYQAAEAAAQPTGQATEPHDTVSKVTGRDGGAKRDSYFRKRDYE